jgi:hypothetical protein
LHFVYTDELWVVVIISVHTIWCNVISISPIIECISLDLNFVLFCRQWYCIHPRILPHLSAFSAALPFQDRWETHTGYTLYAFYVASIDVTTHKVTKTLISWIFL